jgi:hypothetical protein
MFVRNQRSLLCFGDSFTYINVICLFSVRENIPLMFQNLFLEVLLWVLDEPLLLVEQRFFAWCGPNLFRVVMCDVMMCLMYTFGSKSLLM